MKKKGIGLKVTPRNKKCSDKKCPFHGNVGVRKNTFTGLITSDKMARTVTVAWVRRAYLPKYERYEKRRSRLKAHNPECINAKKGDVVMIAETRPLSKTKNFVVVEVLGKETKKEALKEEAIQEQETKGVGEAGEAEKKKTTPEKNR
ncbi:30S ribosomal protein S17 [Candidatus Woesearchaeota archaeon]|nr:30S ribosomal protein S17 [Candidatus Woesearchaeota archaeon]